VPPPASLKTGDLDHPSILQDVHMVANRRLGLVLAPALEFLVNPLDGHLLVGEHVQDFRADVVLESFRFLRIGGDDLADRHVGFEQGHSVSGCRDTTTVKYRHLFDDDLVLMPPI